MNTAVVVVLEPSVVVVDVEDDKVVAGAVLSVEVADDEDISEGEVKSVVVVVVDDVVVADVDVVLADDDLDVVVGGTVDSCALDVVTGAELTVVVILDLVEDVPEASVEEVTVV